MKFIPAQPGWQLGRNGEDHFEYELIVGWSIKEGDYGDFVANPITVDFPESLYEAIKTPDGKYLLNSRTTVNSEGEAERLAGKLNPMRPAAKGERLDSEAEISEREKAYARAKKASLKNPKKSRWAR